MPHTSTLTALAITQTPKKDEVNERYTRMETYPCMYILVDHGTGSPTTVCSVSVHLLFCIIIGRSSATGWWRPTLGRVRVSKPSRLLSGSRSFASCPTRNSPQRHPAFVRCVRLLSCASFNFHWMSYDGVNHENLRGLIIHRLGRERASVTSPTGIIMFRDVYIMCIIVLQVCSTFRCVALAAVGRALCLVLSMVLQSSVTVF